MKKVIKIHSSYGFAIKIVTVTIAALIFICHAGFAQKSTKWIAPPDACNTKNPLAGNTAVLKDAKVLYTQMCAPCHGDKGRGDGPAAAALNPKPADHSSKAIQDETDGSLFWKMTTGRGPMQSFKVKLTEAQRWSLVNYIRTLKKG